MSETPPDEAIADLLRRVDALQTALETANAEQKAILLRFRELAPTTQGEAPEDTVVMGLPSTPHPWRGAAFGALAATVLGALGFLMIGRAPPPPSAVLCPPVLAATAEPIPPPPPRSVPDPEPVSVPTPAPTVAPPTPAVAPPTASVSASRVVRRRCDPPYTLGADGVKRYKPECLEPESDIFSNRY